MTWRVARLVAALTLAGAVSLGYVGRPAQAAVAPTHVAIVVAGFGPACVPWHSGMTGADVLSSQFSVSYGQAPPYVGFVLKINGQGTTHPDLTHYWAYFHNSGGGWAYSGSGAAGYHPQPGTLEGWAYDNGQNPAPQPPGSNYAAICGGQDPAPPPTRAPTHAPVTHRASPAPPARSGQSGRANDPNQTTAESAPHDPATSSGTRSTASSGRRSPVRSASGGSTSDASHDVVGLVGAKEGAKHTSPAPALGTALALLAAAGLGGVAFWRLRRHKHG